MPFKKVWIEFGRINNLKCVDYFRVTYLKSDKTGVTKVTSDPINRLERGAQVTVVPCTLYTFRVAAYEEFQGTGRRFKMLSNEVNFTLDYTPKFIKNPIVWEKKASPLSNARQRQQAKRERRGISTNYYPLLNKLILLSPRILLASWMFLGRHDGDPKNTNFNTYTL